VITSAQAAEYLDQALGVTTSGLFLDSAIARVATAEQAMIDAGYDAATQAMVQCMAVAIIASAGMPRRIKSQGSPSGASRSFDNYERALTALRRSLGALDTADTVAGLIGPDPETQTLMMVVA
jgi:hypothetical protein